MKHASRIIIASVCTFAFITMLGPIDAFACGSGGNHGNHGDGDHHNNHGGGDHVAQHSEGGEHDQVQVGKPSNGFGKKPAIGTKAKCPVMGNEFTVTKDTKSSVYKGKHYVFCCPGCKPTFDKNPKKYIK